MKEYGAAQPPIIPFQDISVPTALFSGFLDNLAPIPEVNWIADQMGDMIVFNKQWDIDHFSFVLGNDMSFFSVDAVNLLK